MSDIGWNPDELGEMMEAYDDAMDAWIPSIIELGMSCVRGLQLREEVLKSGVLKSVVDKELPLPDGVSHWDLRRPNSAGSRLLDELERAGFDFKRPKFDVETGAFDWSEERWQR